MACFRSLKRYSCFDHFSFVSRAILHDEKRYPNPEIFDPTRHLTADDKIDVNAPDPTEAVFGFGRRICAGRYFAMDSMWITIAYILATLNIEKPVDDSGRVIEPSGEYTKGFLTYVTLAFTLRENIADTETQLRYPVPFKASFKPRSKAAEVLIQATAMFD